MVLCIILRVFSGKKTKLRYTRISIITLNNPLSICICLVPSHWCLPLTTNLSVKVGVTPSSSSLWAVHHHSILCLPQPYRTPLILSCILLIPKLYTNVLFLAMEPHSQLRPQIHKDYIFELSVNNNPKSHTESTQNFSFYLIRKSPSIKHVYKDAMKKTVAGN